MSQPMQQSKLDNYNSERGAEAYKRDYQDKVHRKVSDRIERRIYGRFFAQTGRVSSLLDLPCGAGRLYAVFAQNADRVFEADWSMTMVSLGRKDHGGSAAGYMRCSALQIPLRARAVLMVVSVRLSHHLESQELRAAHLRELFRVADRFVVVTWFSHHSLKNWLRRLRAPFQKRRAKNTMRTSDVVGLAAEAGFELIDRVPLSRIGSGHLFGLFARATHLSRGV